MIFGFTARQFDRRRAMTLVELLVVLAVVTVLAGISLPSVKRSLREQRVKRGASQVQAFVEDARARAILSGGGGVIIDRLGSANTIERSQSIRMRLAKVPPAYTGDTGLSKCTVLVRKIEPTIPPSTLPADSAQLDQISLWFDSTAIQMRRSAIDLASNPPVVPTLINIGDTIFLGEAGLPLRITNILAGSAALAMNYDIGGPPGVFPQTAIAGGTITSWTVALVERVERNADLRRFHRQSTSFVIKRQPRPAIAMPATMPAGTAIDLTASGIGRQGNEFSPLEIAGNYISPNAPDGATDPLNPFAAVDPMNALKRYEYESIWIMFGPRGQVTEVYVAAPLTQFINVGGTLTATLVPVLQPVAVTGDIHLLVGRAGQVKTAPGDQLEDSDPDPFEDEASDGKTPLLDSDSVWVTIKSRSGEVLASPWTQPVIDVPVVPVTNAGHRTRLRDVIGRARELAVRSRDGGSL